MRTVSPAPGPAVGAPVPGDRTRSRAWSAVAAVEAVLAAAAVLLDLLIPSLVMLALAAISLAVRHRGPGSLGLTRFRGTALVAKLFVLALAWSAFQLALTMPIANHVSGQKRDLSVFEDLQGNVGMLAVLLVLGWVLGALAEEVAYRGYLFTRVRDACGAGRAGLVAAVVLSSVLFGIAHSEQGLIGVVVVTIDGLYFSALRLHYRTLWASVLAHGFNNTIGFVAFFLVGPMYGLW